MQQHVSVITLGVADPARSQAFYESLGWTPALVTEGTVFFQMNGAVLALWSRAALAEDAGIEDDGTSWGGTSLASNVSSNAEVDRVVELARASGATVTREPAATFWGGYTGVFRDPDGHAWEVAFNPGWELATDGSILIPQPGE
jgi:catechol 2,3-dioxygenase-like lactoylglutathione lyase family enzyme